MIRTWLVRLTMAAVCVAPISALADPNGPSWKPEFGIETGITVGGGNLLTSGVTGQPKRTPPNVSLYAGNTFFYQGYYRQAIGQTGLSFKAAAGGAYVCQIPSCLDLVIDYIVQDSNNSIGNYYFGNLSGDLAVEYAWEGGRVGVGRTFRTFNLLTSADHIYPFQDVYLKPAQGWFVEYEVDHVGLRFTHLIYRSGVSNYSLNGSNVGIYVHANYHDEDWYPGGRYYRQGEAMTRETLALAFNPREWSL
jgi:hypothetical protein